MSAPPVATISCAQPVVGAWPGLAVAGADHAYRRAVALDGRRVRRTVDADRQTGDDRCPALDQPAATRAASSATGGVGRRVPTTRDARGSAESGAIAQAVDDRRWRVRSRSRAG